MMKQLIQQNKFFVKQLKNIASQSWIEKPADAYVKFSQRQIDPAITVKYERDIKFEKKNQTQQQKPSPVPYSPKMGPYTVPNPKIYNKTYRWCSCGMSLNQPFCDGSHEGTSFKPVKFTIQQNVKQVNLCGCKLTTDKPFCDKKSCGCSSSINNQQQ